MKCIPSEHTLKTDLSLSRAVYAPQTRSRRLLIEFASVEKATIYPVIRTKSE